MANLLQGHVLFQRLADMSGGDSPPHHVAEVTRHVVEGPQAEPWIVHEGQPAHAGADAGSQQPDAAYPLACQPVRGSTHVLNCLLDGLKGAADVGADHIVGAFQALRAATVMVRHAEAQGADPKALQRLAESHVCLFVAVPLWKDNHRHLASRKVTRVHGVVFGIGRPDGAGESQPEAVKVEMAGL